MKSNRKTFLKKASAAVAAAGLTLAMTAGQAFAALPPEVGTSVAESKADTKEAGGMILGVVVAIAGFAWLRRVIR